MFIDNTLQSILKSIYVKLSHRGGLMKLLNLKDCYIDLEIMNKLYTMIMKNNHVEIIDFSEFINEVIRFYNTNHYLINFFNSKELEILKQIILNEISYENIKMNDSYVIQLLKQKLVIYDTGNNFEIFDEIKDSIFSLINCMDDYQDEIRLQEICVGLCNAYGMVEKSNFFSYVKNIYGNITDIQIEEQIKNTDYFFNKINILTLTKNRREIVYYCYKDLGAIEDYLKLYGEFSDMPENPLSYEQVKEYSVYTINYLYPIFQEFLGLLKRYSDNLNEVELVNHVLITSNTLDETMDLKVFIYNSFNHCSKNAEVFFKILNQVDTVLIELPSWKSKAYTLQQMREMIEKMKEEMFQDIQEQMQSVNGLKRFGNLSSLMDLDEEFDEDDEYDMFDDNVDRNKLN